MSKQAQFILTIDQSTSATKVMLFDASANLVHRVSLAHEQFYPAEGFVEHDAEEIFENTLTGMLEVLKAAGKNASDLAVVSITNQRETSLIWNRNTGKPIANAAVWQCQRGKNFCKTLNDQGYGPKIREKTGLLVDPYFSASKLRWLINHFEGAKESAQKGDLLLGTIDSWLLWKLTNGKVHATDLSNACRTMLFNINTLKWDEELIISAARKTGHVLTVEEHSIFGGLGGAVAEVISQSYPVKMKILGIPDENVINATPLALFEHYGLTGSGICRSALELLK